METASVEPASRSSNTPASARVVCLLAIHESLCQHLEPQGITRFKAALISTILSTREYYIFTNLVQRPTIFIIYNQLLNNSIYSSILFTNGLNSKPWASTSIRPPLISFEVNFILGETLTIFLLYRLVYLIFITPSLLNNSSSDGISISKCLPVATYLLSFFRYLNFNFVQSFPPRLFHFL